MLKKIKALWEEYTTGAVFVGLSMIATSKFGIDLGVVTQMVEAYYAELVSVLAIVSVSRAQIADKYKSVRGE